MQEDIVDIGEIDLTTDEVTVKEIQVLSTIDKTPRRIYTMDVPFVDDKVNEFDIITSIFSDMEVMKDNLGYKVVNNNIEQRIKVTEVNDPRFCYRYVVDVQSIKMVFQESFNFSNLLNSEKFSDVTLSVGGRVIHAHKNILANRSPVFDAMFMHDMQESQSSQVEIKELDYKTMYDFLYYLYAGKFREDCTNDVFGRYSNLLVAADRYCVRDLKEQCKEKLVTVLKIGNALECLVLADLHNANGLKMEVKDFIVENADKIIKLPSYKSFLREHPDLSIEIVDALIIEKNNLKSLLKKKNFR